MNTSDPDGKTPALPSWEGIINDVIADGGGEEQRKRSASSSLTTSSGDQRLSTNVLLTNAERNALHVEIYSYFEWLMIQVEKLEEETAAAVAEKDTADYTASSLRELLSKLESIFTVVGYGKVDTNATNLPLLESSLRGKLLSNRNNALVGEESKKIKRSASSSSSTTKNNMEQWTQLDFDIMFDKLVTYKNEHGHPNVPAKYTKDVQLGSWVSGLRSMKKAWDSGEVDDGGAATTLASQKKSIVTYLNIERIQKLASIGFVWDKVVLKRSEKKSFNERLDELQTYHTEHGNYNAPRNSSLGEWLHTQRSLFGKRDARFMEVKAPQMIAIGYVFDLRGNTSVSWEDRFQQLVEYKQNYGNFDIPSASAIDDGNGDDDELNDKNKFYKWVRRLHNEHRAFEKGTSSKLTAERMEKLQSIGFQFHGRKYRDWHSDPVPNISFEQRIQQLQTFLADTGTLNVDHNYKHNSNLGGWAVEMSSQYADWKSGKTQPSQEDIAKFDQLTTLGFQFNCGQHYGTKRSWEDQYNALVKFKEQNGNARVPLKYKADLRLGKWVQVQRQQYKLLQEGKKSQLTDDRIQKLLSLDSEIFV